MVYPQQLQDSIRELPQFDVEAGRIFLQENAGMKQTRIDSAVFSQKINASLAELISENTPVFIHSHGRGALATASFRGTAASHTYVSWNGMPLNSPMLGSTDFSLIPVYVADEMILNHGTSSLANGSGGLGGSIAINNRPQWNIPFTINYLQSAGNYSTFNSFLEVKGATEKTSLRARLYRSSSKNDYTYVNRLEADLINGELVNPIDTNLNGAFGTQGFLQEIYFLPAKNQVVSFTGWSQWSERGIPQATSYEGPGIPNQNESIENSHRYIAGWGLATPGGTIALRSGFSQNQLDYIRRTQVAGLGVLPDVYSVSTMQGLHNQFRINQSITSKLSVAGVFEWNFHEVETRDTILKTGYERTRNEFLSSVTLNYALNPSVFLHSILRIDRNELHQTPLLPFLGINWKVISNQNLIIKANIARNYKLPNLNDLYWQPGGNPDLEPEKGLSIESGIHHQFNLRRALLDWEATVYRSDIKDWILWIPSFKGYWQPFNVKRVISQGIEMTGKITARYGNTDVHLAANYVLTQARNFDKNSLWGKETHGKQLVFIPEHSGNILFSASYKDYSITWQHNSFSERFTTTSNDPGRRNRLYPYFMNDLSTGKTFHMNEWTLFARFTIHNLFNETYRSVLMHPMPGRNYLITLRLQYQKPENLMP
jgi:iron complex outermembrane receptor protein